MIVVDVNVVAYLFIEGQHTGTSEGVLEADPEWAAPLLWRSEWRSVLSGYLRRGQLDRRSALELVDAAEAVLRGREHLVDAARALDLVTSSSCSAYDCEYVALAQTLDVPLITTNKQILSAFPTVALSPASYLAGRTPEL